MSDICLFQNSDGLIMRRWVSIQINNGKFLFLIAFIQVGVSEYIMCNRSRFLHVTGLTEVR